MSRALNMVSFDYPFPPIYGGVIDVFYKIKALQQAGIEIHLHYFAEEEKKHEALQSLCSSIHYYSKSSIWSSQLMSNTPLRMLLRRNKKLENNLAQSNFPILYEGLHTSYTANSSILAGHKKYLRCHNIEAEYAAQLGHLESNFFKKIAFKIEAKRTQKFEQNLAYFNALFPITQEDANHFKQRNARVIHLPVFHAHETVEVLPGIGDYILFHGNLSVKENLATAQWIAQTLAPKASSWRFIIAGKSDNLALTEALRAENVLCILNPAPLKMKTLIQQAQIVLLKTAVPSGIKLKLIDSLAWARHIVADSNTVKNAGLQSLVHLANSTAEVLAQMEALKNKEVSPTALEQRKDIFKNALNNTSNASKLIKEIF